MAVGQTFGCALLVMYTVVAALHQLYDPISAEKRLSAQVSSLAKQCKCMAAVAPVLQANATVVLYALAAVALIGSFLVILKCRCGAWVLVVYSVVLALTLNNPTFGETAWVDAALSWGVIAGLCFVGSAAQSSEKEKKD